MSTHFHPLRILDVRRETDDAVSILLDPESAAAAFRFTPGQHLTLRANIGGEELRRNYSLCVAPDDGPLRIAIKRMPAGRFSNWAIDTLAAGDLIDAMQPRGHFTWTFDASERRNYLCFASGSGITPILSLIKAGFAIEPASHFTLLYGNRASTSVMFLEELAALKDRYLDRLRVHHFLTAEADDVELFNGRLDQARIAEVLESLVDPKSVDVAFVCGPGGMMDAAEQAMREAGLPQDRVLTERFSAGDQPVEDGRLAAELRQKAEGRTVVVTLEGRRRRIAFHAEQGSILANARAAGLPAPFACSAGVCATCRAKLVRGDVKMAANYGLSSAEVAQGYILTCQAIPLSEDVHVDYDG